MRPVRRLVIGAIVLAAGAGGYVGGRALLRPSQRVIQPISFNHAKHVGDLGIECSTCHEYYETSEHSGLPGMETCLGCHEEPQTDSSEEAKLVAAGASGQDLEFRKLFRMPAHVFYSHRRHVAIAKLECTTCHGDVAATEVPPERPLVRVTMDFCVDCHERDGISGDCTACHQ